MKYDAVWWSIALGRCGVRQITAIQWVDALVELIKPEAFSSGEVEIAPFMGQALYETGRLEHVVENLTYSAPRLMAVWPNRFKTLEDAAPYVGNPEKLANAVYGGRMGNTEIGDGWRFRGRGIPMVTGRSNYALVARNTGLDVVNQPDLLEEPRAALQCALAWWERSIPDAVMGDNAAITRRVQGGAEGLDQRAALTEKFKTIIEGSAQ